MKEDKEHILAHSTSQRSNFCSKIFSFFQMKNVEQSRWKKAIVLVASNFYMLTLSGILFGWPSIVVVFLEEGVYRELCGKKMHCTEQELRLALVFTLAASCMNVSLLLSGVCKF